MHHVVLDQWSRQQSGLHSRDPRVKAIAVLIFLVVLSTSRGSALLLSCALFALLSAVTLWARLPYGKVLARSCVVIPFTAVFALSAWMEGDAPRAAAMAAKAYLSAFAVLLLVGTTPVPRLLRGLESLGVPSFLLTVTQLLYRYLFVLSEEAQHMRIARSCRAGNARRSILLGHGFKAAAGAVSVLFARSYARAGRIQNAMLARGFDGRYPSLGTLHLEAADGFFLAVSAALPVMIRVAIERSM